MNENERCPECGSWGEERAFPAPQPTCGCARCLRAQRDEARAERDNLLAIIHRDGGHYIGEHGVTKAVADAHATWAAVMRERDEARAEVARLRWLAEAGCENTPTKGCECPGCCTARERAERGEA